MTIILSLVTGQYAVQVSDRLLTQKLTGAGVRYKPWDDAANKSVVVLGCDGLFVLGYSGQAHIAGATTDGWIAEVIAGESLGANKAVARSRSLSRSATSGRGVGETANDPDQAGWLWSLGDSNP